MNRTGTLLIGMVAAACGAGAALADTTLHAEPQKLGDGDARLYVELNADGVPRAIGITFDAGVLSGLPDRPNTWSRCFDKNGNGRIDPHGECNGDYELAFALPQELVERKITPFAWVGVNWNPMGHMPPAPPAWGAPHYDFHFYTVPPDAVRRIRPGPCAELIHCDDFLRARTPVPAQYLHPDHIDVGAAVPAMGNHLIDSRTPELAPGGPPFTHTFIFGAYDGGITFYEPMITHAYLASRPEQCAPIKQPQAWATEGFYPTSYCIRWREADGAYTVSLEDFVHRPAS